jgi:hypothetical protein
MVQVVGNSRCIAPVQLPAFDDALLNCRGRLPGNFWQNLDIPTISEDGLGFREKHAVCGRVKGIVTAFDINVRLKMLNNRVSGWFPEDGCEIDTCQSGDEFRSLSFGKNGTPGAFSSRGGCVVIDPDDQEISESSRLLKVMKVADMKEVEMPVGENDDQLLVAPSCSQLGQLFAVQNLSHAAATPVQPSPHRHGRILACQSLGRIDKGRVGLTDVNGFLNSIQQLIDIQLDRVRYASHCATKRRQVRWETVQGVRSK